MAIKGSPTSAAPGDGPSAPVAFSAAGAAGLPGNFRVAGDVEVSTESQPPGCAGVLHPPASTLEGDSLAWACTATPRFGCGTSAGSQSACMVMWALPAAADVRAAALCSWSRLLGRWNGLLAWGWLLAWDGSGSGLGIARRRPSSRWTSAMSARSAAWGSDLTVVTCVPCALYQAQCTCQGACTGEMSELVPAIFGAGTHEAGHCVSRSARATCMVEADKHRSGCRSALAPPDPVETLKNCSTPSQKVCPPPGMGRAVRGLRRSLLRSSLFEACSLNICRQ